MKKRRERAKPLNRKTKPGQRRRRTRLVIGIGVFVVACVVVCRFYLKNRDLGTIYLGDVRLRVEVEDTPAGRRRGLMYRRKLPRNQGMLFVFEEPDFHAFWMKDTYIPLSIAFVSEEMEIVQIDSMFPRDVLNHRFPEERVKYAIEVNQGWFYRHGVKVGDRVIMGNPNVKARMPIEY
jgi:uncharacterized membrane protein (UPF0127 family)